MMNNRTVNLIPLVNTIYDHSGMYLSFLSGEGLLWTIGNSFAVVLVLGMVFSGGITDGVLAAIRRWHGSIDDQFSNIDNLLIKVGDPPAGRSRRLSIN